MTSFPDAQSLRGRPARPSIPSARQYERLGSPQGEVHFDGNGREAGTMTLWQAIALCSAAGFATYGLLAWLVILRLGV